MTRQALRNTYPFHATSQVARGYRPQPAKGKNLGSILVGIFMWGAIIAAGVATSLPILKWLSRI